MAQDNFYDYVNGKWLDITPIPKNRATLTPEQIVEDKNIDLCISICEADQGIVGQIYRLGLISPTKISDKISDILSDVNKIQSHEEYLSVSAKLSITMISQLINIDKAPLGNIWYPMIKYQELGLPDNTFYTDQIKPYYIEYISEICTMYGYHVNAVNICEYEYKLSELQTIPSSLNIYKWSDVAKHMPEYFDYLGLNISDNQIIFADKTFDILRLKDLIYGTDIKILSEYLIFRICHNFAQLQTKEIEDKYFDFRIKKLLGIENNHSDQIKALYNVTYYANENLCKLYEEKYLDKKKIEDVMIITEKIKETCKKINKLRSNIIFDKSTIIEPMTEPEIIIGSGIRTDTNYQCIDDMISIHLEWKKNDWNELCKSFFTQIDKNYIINRYASYKCRACLYNVYEKIVHISYGHLDNPFIGNTFEEDLGGIGWVICHEITHKYDLNNQWSENAKKIITLYSEHGIDPKTVKENIADIGGMQIALLTLKSHYKDQITPDIYRRFFESYAKSLREKYREEIKEFLKSDVHAPRKYRVNLVLGHFDEFYETYDIKETDLMYIKPEQRVKIYF